MTALEVLAIAVDADDLDAVFRLREKLLAKSMAPFRAFDAAQLYQLSKACSTNKFLENTVGLSPGRHGGICGFGAQLGAMPRPRPVSFAGRLWSGQVRAVAANVAVRGWCRSIRRSKRSCWTLSHR